MLQAPNVPLTSGVSDSLLAPLEEGELRESLVVSGPGRATMFPTRIGTYTVSVTVSDGCSMTSHAVSVVTTCPPPAEIVAEPR